MRLATIETNGRTRAARLEPAGQAVPLPFDDLGALLAAPDWRTHAAAAGPLLNATEFRLSALVPRPGKIICLGLNYRSHIDEMGRDRPKYPTLFAKFSESLIGPSDDIVLPRVSTEIDWEAELAIVIGSACRHAAEADALDAVAGYTVLNDITVRDWQHRTREFLAGKTFEATTPVGPVLVTPDELPVNALGLTIECKVDGVTMQKASTADLLFEPAAIVSYVSTILTLRPGDIIATGTPGGVGAGRTPKVFLTDGQTVETSIEGIGSISNRCRLEPAG
ncbi:fumarylacetoacetate hydrolase family protein [Kribbella solani]|uniref:fumarylacetoacetate hydrolase family protein n=1 Tax=Kribbella solani TaxID=236067 RepID=UPI0029A9838A|nr:fumarylacetoacetate hydrolase family protein [Kribbella solani]MDX3001844.1 fumarylacetoacetate hydrolase family protein [Kribbella solani]